MIPFYSYFKGFISAGSERSVLVKKNILFSFVLQGISVICSFLLVPLTLNYLKADEYGVWLTISSIITWFNVCDIGIGMGLKNRLGEALARGDYELGKKYVSLTYSLLSIIIIVILVVFAVVSYFLNWNRILNIYTLNNGALYAIVLIVFSFFCLNFVVKTIGVILSADQRISISSLLGVLGSVLALISIWILTKVSGPSLMSVALIFSAAPVVVSLIGSIYLFRTKYKRIRPNFTSVDFSNTKDLIGLSLKFFVLQVSSIIVFTTANMIITQTIGPQEVTVYNVCFKYFNAVTLVFNLLLGPMWPAYTNAYAVKDFNWMSNAVKRTRAIWLMTSVGTLLLIVISPWVYQLWVGNDISIPFELSVVMGIYVIIGNWNNIYAQMLAGVGKIKLSIYNSLFNAVIFIPLCIYLCKSMGVMGVTVAMTVTILTSTFWQPIQSSKIIKGTARGLWNE